MKQGKKAPYHLWRSCLSKKTFASQEEAEGELCKFVQGLGDNADRPSLLHVYTCDFRPHFHIGHAALPLRYTDPDAARVK